MTGKVRRLIITEELLMNFYQGEHRGYRVIKNGIPRDAKIVNVRHGWPNCIEVLVESEEFEEVEYGQEIPYIVPVCETVT